MAVDLSMSEILAAQLGDLAGSDPDDTYRQPAVGGGYFVRLPGSGRLLALTLVSPADVDTFQRLAGCSLPRSDRRGRLFDLCGGALADLSDDEAQGHLLAAGLRASLVYTAAQLAREDHLRASERFQTVESREKGSYLVTALPWTVTGRTKRPLTAAPERSAADCM